MYISKVFYVVFLVSLTIICAASDPFHTDWGRSNCLLSREFQIDFNGGKNKVCYGEDDSTLQDAHNEIKEDAGGDGIVGGHREGWISMIQSRLAWWPWFVWWWSRRRHAAWMSIMALGKKVIKARNQSLG